MPAYTIFPYTENGSALMFEASSFPNRKAAISRAEELFAEHHLAAQVVVWEGDKQVYSRERNDGQASDLVWTQASHSGSLDPGVETPPGGAPGE